jgi:hypothetical protein
MPFPGPKEQLLYSACEAYNVIGRRRFEHEWTGRYSGKPALPDLDLLHTLADSGAEMPDDARQFLEADPEEANAAQTQRRREEQVVNDLVDAIRWGKAAAWLRVPDWQLMSPFDWRDGSEALPRYKALLREDISAVAKDGRPDPRRLGITKRKLDAWAGYLTPIDERSLLVEHKPRPAHRPGIDKPWLLQEFQRTRRCAGPPPAPAARSRPAFCLGPCDGHSL